MQHFHRWLLDWGNSKRENRRGWRQALHSIAVSSRNDKAIGAIVFHAFPQEVVDKVIGETGGQPIQLSLPGMPDSEIVFDESGNVFRLERKRGYFDSAELDQVVVKELLTPTLAIFTKPAADPSGCAVEY